jgi:predicted dehydrogenase
MLRIGLVDLDTSHPEAFTRILRTMEEVSVHAVWDGHDVWPSGYEREFARTHDIPVVCKTLEEMPDYVDAAMIHGVNWETHCDKALVFLKAGKPVLIDKPVVGSARDCRRLLDMREKYGVPVFGGSSLRCAREVTALRTAMGPREELVSVVASGPGDFFSYGIHTTEMLQGLVGIGIRSVRWIADSRSHVLAAQFHDGLTALIHLQLPFHEWSLSVFSEDGAHTTTVSTDGLYQPFLKNFVAIARGDHSDFSLAGPVEAVRFHLAARRARSTGGEVLLDAISADEAFDGRAFAREYAASKRKPALPHSGGRA